MCDLANSLGIPLRDISKAESHICDHLRPILASLPSHAAIDDSEEFDEVLRALERFLPEVLDEVHPEFTGEGLDGVYAAHAQKTAEREIEIIGLCCILSDQTLTPLHLRLQLAQATDYVSWVDCRLGENTATGMRREPYRGAIVNDNMLHVMKRLDSIDWYYHVSYGERTSNETGHTTRHAR